MNSRQLARLAALETRRPARGDILTDFVLNRVTNEELSELSCLFRSHGVEEIEDLPADAQVRIKTLAKIAATRTPAPWASSPEYAAWAERVRLENPAIAGLPEP